MFASAGPAHSMRRAASLARSRRRDRKRTAVSEQVKWRIVSWRSRIYASRRGPSRTTAKRRIHSNTDGRRKALRCDRDESQRHQDANENRQREPALKPRRPSRRLDDEMNRRVHGGIRLTRGARSARLPSWRGNASCSLRESGRLMRHLLMLAVFRAVVREGRQNINI